MADLDGDPSIGGVIDLERAVIDPDYRRAVMVLLRRVESRVEAAAVPWSSAAAPAVGES
jgi:hypothetical protein